MSGATFPGANGRIAFIGYGDSSDPSGIFTVLPNGSGLRHLTSHVSDPSWSADGRSLVYLAGGGQVFTMDADGGNQTQVTHGSVEKVKPGFSPNGRRIVYASAPTTGDPRSSKSAPTA